jgi:hypothetical protein
MLTEFGFPPLVLPANVHVMFYLVGDSKASLGIKPAKALL